MIDWIVLREVKNVKNYILKYFCAFPNLLNILVKTNYFLKSYRLYNLNKILLK